MRDQSTDLPAAVGRYSEAWRAEAVRLANEVGTYQAAKRLGIGYNTLRRWADPEFREGEYLAGRSHKRKPCEECGKLTNVYGRKHPEYGLVCRSCLATAMADDKRGYRAKDIQRMYLVDLMSTTEIAAQTGTAQSAIAALLVRNGVTLRDRRHGQALRPGGKPEQGKVDPDEITRLIAQGMPVTKIAVELACSVPTVKYHLSRLYAQAAVRDVTRSREPAHPPAIPPAADANTETNVGRDSTKLTDRIAELSDRKLSTKQLALAQFLVSHRYVTTPAEAVHIVDGIRAFNQERSRLRR
jgi:hypothetical protein